MRDLATETALTVQGANLEPAYLGEFDFDGGSVYLWTGLGDLSWAGKTYQGGGNLVGISELQENEGLEASGVSCVLSGVPSTLVATALLENPRNRRMRIYLAFIARARNIVQEDSDLILTEDGGNLLASSLIIGEPIRVFTGFMDNMRIEDDGENSSITVTGESSRIIGQRAKKRRYTDEEQRKLFVNDRGLEFIPNLKDKELVW